MRRTFLLSENSRKALKEASKDLLSRSVGMIAVSGTLSAIAKGKRISSAPVLRAIVELNGMATDAGDSYEGDDDSLVSLFKMRQRRARRYLEVANILSKQLRSVSAPQLSQTPTETTEENSNGQE